jgi:hypothetical protein
MRGGAAGQDVNSPDESLQETTTIREPPSHPAVPVLSYGTESASAKWWRRGYFALTVCAVLCFVWFWTFGSLRLEFLGNPVGPVGFRYRWFHQDLTPNEVLDTAVKWRPVVSATLNVLAFVWFFWTGERVSRWARSRHSQRCAACGQRFAGTLDRCPHCQKAAQTG